MKNIELGNLVRSVDDGVVGIVTWVDDALDADPVIYQIVWGDGLKGLHVTDDFEVIA